ncbi:HEAT repeat domain-containing protein [Leptolyngbya sp. FACHB-261]|uniref:HEAT repeat domain-containing protein n=1 Tax=Leptolyngbya sp. FACHB-261 TaxID=2692806 RepID=UPI001686FD01|nr:HEAT repeat domain-containing protein [Leptolyngbya sp. FACHB-261]MBD2102509.1 HEAT repeat domain-containing protein [Leptolyngbya sp. FACHB-261]
MVIKWLYGFVSASNLLRCLVLLSLLLFSSSCLFESIERKGDRGDCSDVTNGISEQDLYSLGSEEVNIDNLKASLKSWNSATRYQALWVLIFKTEPHTILTTLMTAVQDEDPRVRETSIKGLATAAESQATLIPQIFPILTQAMRDRDPGVRVAGFSGLTTVALHQKTLIPRVLPLFTNGLKDRSACVRASSASFLESLIRESGPYKSELELVIPDLIVMASRDSSAWARRHALDGLGSANVASEEIVPILITVLKSDPDATLRNVSATALGQKVAEPEATKALIEAISDQDARVRTSAVYSLLKIEPNPLINQSNLEKLSDQGLKTAIWALERWSKGPDVENWKKTAIPPILNALIAERSSRLQK